jgi:predicted N-acyltransferase
VVEFSSPRKEDYFASLKGSRRHILRKKLRRSAAQAALHTEVIQRPQGEVLDELFALFGQTYERAETRFEKLNRKFFALIAEQPLAHFIVLREPASGAMVACMLCFELGPKVINKFIGIDYRRPKEWLLYFRLWDAAVDWALARGAQSIQSGQTGYAPKIETGHQLVPLVNYCMHRNFAVHAVARACARHIDWSSLDDALARHVRAHPEAQGARTHTWERPKSEIPT